MGWEAFQIYLSICLFIKQREIWQVRFEKGSCDSAAIFYFFWKICCIIKWIRARPLQKFGGRMSGVVWIVGWRERIFEACVSGKARERHKLTSYSDQFQKGASTTFVFRTRGANHLKLIPKVSKNNQKNREPKIVYQHNQQGPCHEKNLNYGNWYVVYKNMYNKSTWEALWGEIERDR